MNRIIHHSGANIVVILDMIKIGMRAITDFSIYYYTVHVWSVLTDIARILSMRKNVKIKKPDNK